MSVCELFSLQPSPAEVHAWSLGFSRLLPFIEGLQETLERTLLRISRLLSFTRALIAFSLWHLWLLTKVRVVASGKVHGV